MEDNKHLTLPSHLPPCCWKLLRQEEDVQIAERTCSQACDHQHHEEEKEHPGVLCVAA